MALPHIFATQPAGNVPASYLDDNFNYVDLVTAGGTINGTLAVGNNVTVTGTINPSGGIIGLTNNSDAAVGIVGEDIESTVAQGSALSVVSGTPKNITSLSLTAGDWDVWSNIIWIPAATTTTGLLELGISIVSATIPTPPNQGGYARDYKGGIAGATSGPFSLFGQMRIRIGVTTTVYLVSNQGFGTSTMTAYGFIGARRRR